MKAKILIICLVFAGVVSCNSQNSDRLMKKESQQKPHENITVNKKYDDNGNLIEFDSTYTSYYSSSEGDTVFMGNVPENFQLYFNHNWPGISSNDYFGMDSTFIPGFYHDNFFEDQFFNQDDAMLRMIREMDSIKNEFFKMHAKQSMPNDL
jgi:hypothetical protein